MSSGRSTFWRGFDTAERAIGKPLEDLVASTGYATVMVHGLKVQRAVGGLVGRVVRGGVGAVLSAVNLPTGSDVQRLSRQLATLTSEVRALSLAAQPVRDEPAAPPAGSAARDTAPARPRRTGPRAVR